MFTPTLNLKLNTKKINKEGLAPVYLRITINGTRSEISTKVYVNPAKWDERKSEVKGKEPVDIRRNKILFDFTTKIYEALDELKNKRFDINASNLKLALTGELFQKTTVLELYRKYLEYLQVRIGSDFSPSSYEIHKTTFDQVHEFLQHEKREHIGIDEFSNPNFHRLEAYLKKYKENQHNTVFKKIERFRSMFKWAYEMEMIDRDIRKELNSKKECEFNNFKRLLNQSLRWEKSQAIRAFISHIETNPNLTIEGCENIQEWIQWARCKADWYDPTVERKDEYLSQYGEFHQALLDGKKEIDGYNFGKL